MNTSFKPLVLEKDRPISRPRIQPFLRLASEMQHVLRCMESDFSSWEKSRRQCSIRLGKSSSTNLEKIQKIYRQLESYRDQISQSLSRCPSISGVKIWDPTSPLFSVDQPAFRHLLMERIRGATDPMTRACLNLVDKPYLDMAFHKIFNGSDCELCQRNHPHESQIAIRAKCGIKQMKAVQDSMYLPWLEDCPICFEPNQMPVEFLGCGHISCCLSCAEKYFDIADSKCLKCNKKLTYTKSHHRIHKFNKYPQFAKFKYKIPKFSVYPQFNLSQIIGPQTKSKFELARLFSEMETEFDEIEQKGRDLMNNLALERGPGVADLGGEGERKRKVKGNTKDQLMPDEGVSRVRHGTVYWLPIWFEIFVLIRLVYLVYVSAI